MPSVITARDVEDLLARGGDPGSLPADAIWTPSARDVQRSRERAFKGSSNLTSTSPSSAPAPASPTSAPTTSANPTSSLTSLTSRSPRAELEAYFNSPAARVLKEQLCDIGRRLWGRAYVDGNGGNIAIRVGEDLAICTPTLVSKGFMKPEDMCLVDFEGNQLAGVKKRTSEILMHLQIMKRQPKAVATCHCHPPYSTGFAVAGLVPPTCMIPEYEVFSSVAVAPYRTPGTPEMGQLVADLVDKHNTILMANHGVVSWSHNNVEDAYFKMEILEAYCRTILVTAQLGVPGKTMSAEQLKDLLKIKQNLGIPDPRHGLKECELCDNAEWRPGVSCAVPPKSGAGSSAPGGAPIGMDADAEQMVKTITDQIMAQMK